MGTALQPEIGYYMMVMIQIETVLELQIDAYAFQNQFICLFCFSGPTRNGMVSYARWILRYLICLIDLAVLGLF